MRAPESKIGRTESGGIPRPLRPWVVLVYSLVTISTAPIVRNIADIYVPGGILSRDEYLAGLKHGALVSTCALPFIMLGLMRLLVTTGSGETRVPSLRLLANGLLLAVAGAPVLLFAVPVIIAWPLVPLLIPALGLYGVTVAKGIAQQWGWPFASPRSVRVVAAIAYGLTVTNWAYLLFLFALTAVG
jgi:hypothetical protein